MALLNRVWFSTATTGTGSPTIGAATSAAFCTPADAGAINGVEYTWIIEDGDDFEFVRGVYNSAGPTFDRTEVLLSQIGGVVGTTKLTLSGSATVRIDASAQDLYIPSRPEGRLTLTSATPVMTSDVSGASTIYYTPHIGNLAPIYDGSRFVMKVFSEISNATAQSSTGKAGPAAVANNSNYDLFVWDDLGTLRLTRGPAWTSDTARGTGAGTTEIERKAGLWVNKVTITNGPAANKGTYVGTVRSNGSATIDWVVMPSPAAAGGNCRLYVWNAYNRVAVNSISRDSTDTWTYNTAAWRAANNSNSNRISFVCGIAEDDFVASYNGAGYTAGSGGAVWGVAFDTTTTFSGTIAYGALNGVATFGSAQFPSKGMGFHFFQAVEYSQSTSTVTFVGDAGVTYFQSGLIAGGFM